MSSPSSFSFLCFEIVCESIDLFIKTGSIHAQESAILQLLVA